MQRGKEHICDKKQKLKSSFSTISIEDVDESRASLEIMTVTWMQTASTLLADITVLVKKGLEMVAHVQVN